MDDGVEQFEAVRSLVTQYFPHIELDIPVLDRKNDPPLILMKFKDRGKGSLDISQSGSGLRTFITLARLLKQTDAQVVLIDEPDAHLHASQQAVVLDLLLDVAASSERQVIIATHSPEILTRAPNECIRWVELTNSAPDDSDEEPDITVLLSRLGATADVYLSRADFPDVIVYVEGKKDRPFIESLIKWCRRSKAANQFPRTLVIAHRDGRFHEQALQSLTKFAREWNSSTRVVGVRDLDWYYGKKPSTQSDIMKGEGWTLLTLPCKELENLLCDADVLYDAHDRKVPKKELSTILEEESNSEELLHEWRVNVQPVIRDRLDRKLANNTKEAKAIEIFKEWTEDSLLRARLVAGRALLGKVRERIKRKYNVSCYRTRIFEHIPTLTTSLASIADAIFPGHDFLLTAPSDESS